VKFHHKFPEACADTIPEPIEAHTLFHQQNVEKVRQWGSLDVRSKG
jgi:hypothetical protein